jgi:hypothetical protein
MRARWTVWGRYQHARRLWTFSGINERNLMKNEPRGRVLPPKMKQMLEYAFLRPLTMRERLKLLFGYTLRIHMAIACEHSPGKTDPRMQISITPQTDPKENL